MTAAAAQRCPADERRHKPRTPARELTELEQFERRCRKDRRLNLTACLVWLLAALSGGKAATATMKPANMERELDATYWSIWKAFRTIGELGWFRETDAGWQRRGDRRKLVQRIRRCSDLNLKVRLLWLLVDITSGIATPDGLVTMSVERIAAQLNCRRRDVRWNLRQLAILGLVVLYIDQYDRYVGCALNLDAADDELQERNADRRSARSKNAKIRFKNANVAV